jgi:CYTH domain-containing protein
VEARDRAERWKVPKDFTALAGGLHDTYRRARRRHRDVAAAPDDETVHEWRKAVKQLWYQARLVEPAAPSVLSALVDRLDDLSEALGDDHDLAVLIERFGADPDAFGGHRVVERTTVLARLQQDELRARALRLGATIFAERPRAFAERIAAYWAVTAEEGPERPTGGILALHADGTAAASDDAATPDDAAASDDSSTSDDVAGGSDGEESAGDVERERKFLVAAHPDLDDDGTQLRQGYLAIEHPVSVRIRDAGDEGCTLTVKAGSGSTRAELEWPIAPQTFGTLWEHTGDRRVSKTRHRIAHGGHTIELDVFHDALDGLVVAEVEFASDEEMAAFEPPDWFGEDVTDDGRYTNAWLAEHGLDGLSTGADASG